MKVALGCDHGGYELKEAMVKFLKKQRYHIIDVGCFSPTRCDYPGFAYQAAKLVREGIADRAIIICKSGIGNSIVANKLKGIRAALCQNLKQAILSRRHNNANVLVMGALYVNKNLAKRIAAAWLKAKVVGGRHAHRVRQIKEIERKEFK